MTTTLSGELCLHWTKMKELYPVLSQVVENTQITQKYIIHTMMYWMDGVNINKNY